MSNLHPLFVHFPIALLTVSLAFEISSLLRSSGELSRIGWWLHVLGTVGILVSVATGLLARDGTTIPPAARSDADSHQQVAFVVATIFVSLLFWRVALRGGMPSRGRAALYVATFSIGVALMWLGAWYGGELVYRHGVGVGTP